MWQKYLVITIIFYFFALLQTSFFAHFNFFGAVPNLVFMLFSLFIFFEKPSTFHVFFLSVVAGFLLDFLSYSHLGISVIILLLIGFLLKKTLALLKNSEESNPFACYLLFFIISLLFYNLLFGSYLYFLNPGRVLNIFSGEAFPGLIYNSLVASALFYASKKFLEKGINNRQLKLFDK